MHADRPPRPAATNLRLLVVDDQPAVRASICRLLMHHMGPTTVVESADTVIAARGVASRLRPQLVLLDMDLAGEDGLQLLQHLPQDTSVIVVTSHADRDSRGRAHRAGARHIVDKQHGALVLLQAVSTVMAAHSRGESCPDAGVGSSVGARRVRP